MTNYNEEMVVYFGGYTTQDYFVDQNDYYDDCRSYEDEAGWDSYEE